MATTSRATTLSVFLERKAAQQEAAMKADLAQRQRDIQEAIDNELESFYDSDSDSDNIDDVDHDNRANGNDELSESSLDVDAADPPPPPQQPPQTNGPYYRHQKAIQHQIRPPIEDSSSYIDDEPGHQAEQRHDDDDADEAIVGHDNETNHMLLLAHNHHDDVDDDDDDDDDDHEEDDVNNDEEADDDDEDENVAVREMPEPAGVIVGPTLGGNAYLQQLALLPSGHPARHLILPSEATSRSTAQLATLSPETTGCGLSSAEYSSSGVQPNQELLLLGHNRLDLNGHSNILPPSMRHNQPYPAVKQRGVDIGVSVVPDNQRDLDQLDILYRARGRHIEELKAQLTELQESSAKEARLLKHKLALTEANRESAEKAATGVEDRLKDALQEIRSLKADSDKRQELTARLLTENEQLKRQLTEASCQNEALTAQLTEMTTAGTIGRVRDQQENFIQLLRNKKDEEIFYLKDRIDRLQAEAAERQADLDAAHALATKLRSQQSDQLIQANKLSASLSQQLQDSQRRCQDLLAAGADSEAAAALRQQLAQRDLAKAITEEMNSALQQEIVDLREQLAMYETAERLGALPPVKSSVLAGDSQSISDGNREATSTSMPNVGPTADRDKNVACLRAELLRCQALFKQKREKVTELQKELIQLKKASHEASLRCERAELVLTEQREQAVAMETKARSAAQKQQEAAVAAAVEASNAEAARLQSLLKEANSRTAKLESELSAAQASLTESAEAQRQLCEQSDQLRSDFADAWERAQREKTAEFERIQRTCQAHFDLCREKMREELLAGFAEERRATVDSYEARLSDVQSLVTQLGQERRELEAKLAQTARQLMKAEAEQPAAPAKVEQRPVSTQTTAKLTLSVAVETRRFELVNSIVQVSLPPPPADLCLSTPAAAAAAAAASSPVDPLAEQETELGRRLQQCYLAAISRIRDEVVGYMADSQERADRRLRRSQRSLCARFALHLRRNIEEKFGCPDAELSVDSVLQLLNQSLNHTMHRSLPSASHLTRRSELLDGEEGDGDSTPTTSASRLSSPTMQQFLLPRQQQPPPPPPPPPPPVAPRSSQLKQRSAAAVASAVATSTPAEKDAGK